MLSIKDLEKTKIRMIEERFINGFNVPDPHCIDIVIEFYERYKNKWDSLSFYKQRSVYSALTKSVRSNYRYILFEAVLERCEKNNSLPISCFRSFCLRYFGSGANENSLNYYFNDNNFSHYFIRDLKRYQDYELQFIFEDEALQKIKDNLEDIKVNAKFLFNELLSKPIPEKTDHKKKKI